MSVELGVAVDVGGTGVEVGWGVGVSAGAKGLQADIRVAKRAKTKTDLSCPANARLEFSAVAARNPFLLTGCR